MIDPAKKEKLLKIRGQLLDVYIEEADPENWTTEESAQAVAEKLLEDGGDKQTAKKAAEILTNWKGERYWEKKNATQTMTMLISLDRFLQEDAPAAGAADPEEAKAAKKEMQRFEKEAKARLARSRPNLKAVEGGKK